MQQLVHGKNYPFDEIVNYSVEVTKPAENPIKIDNSYLVKVTANCLNIRAGAGTNYRVTGQIKDKGTYTIVEDANGQGATKWGKLKSGEGWISLDYTSKATAKVQTTKSIDELAKEVIAGKWGNGTDRKTKLTNAGYDYNAIQKRVNQLLK